MNVRFIIILITTACNAVGQGLEGFDGSANILGAATHGFRSFDNRYEGVHGFPTLFENFVKGEIKLKSGRVVKNQDMNLDVVTNELLVQSSAQKDKIMVVRYDMVESFSLINGDRSMTFVKVGAEDGYFYRLYGGKFQVYKKNFKVVERANYGGAYNNNARRYDEFVDANRYFIAGDGMSLTEFKPKKKDLEKLFPDKNASLKGYFKASKPDFDNDDSLTALFEFIDTH